MAVLKSIQVCLEQGDRRDECQEYLSCEDIIVLRHFALAIEHPLYAMKQVQRHNGKAPLTGSDTKPEGYQRMALLFSTSQRCISVFYRWDDQAVNTVTGHIEITSPQRTTFWYSQFSIVLGAKSRRFQA